MIHPSSLMPFATTSRRHSIIIQLFYTTHKITQAICTNNNKSGLCKANQDNLVNGYNCLARPSQAWPVSVSVFVTVSVSGVNALTGIFVFICATNNKNVIKDAMQSAISIECRIY